MSKKHIEQCVRDSLEAYFRDLRGTDPDRMYDMLLRTVEKPLLEVVMQHADGNQSRAAEWLGMNRNTLRKKLAEHKLIRKMDK
ncbi:MAG: Fis family transcriptional regulator [Burkholderiaceae bacterium]|jgi:Fis family transcriptional regulator|nr:Fis family transcriptional regulator [Burkholderiaceae bacterium]